LILLLLLTFNMMFIIVFEKIYCQRSLLVILIVIVVEKQNFNINNHYRTLSNITAGEQHQIQSVIDAGLMSYLADKLSVGEFDVVSIIYRTLLL
jgi:hypothetical protein